MNEPVSYFFKVLPGNYFGGRVGIFLEPKNAEHLCLGDVQNARGDFRGP